MAKVLEFQPQHHHFMANRWGNIGNRILNTLNSLSDKLPVSSSFIWSFGFLLCFSICNIFLCHSFCLSYCFYGLLFTGGRVVVPFASVVSPLVGETGPGACVSFLVGRLSDCALAIETGSFPSDEQGLFWDVCEPRITMQPIYCWAGLYFCLAACLAWSL